MKNKKSQDPTEAALSAIEDALNIGNDAPEVTAPQPRMEAQRAPQAEPAGEIFAQRSRGTRERLPRPAANDDRQSVGQILQALHRRPSGAPILVALLFSIIWIIGGAAIASIQYRGTGGAVMRLSEIAAQPTFLPALAAIFLPPLLFFMTAMLIRRSQEMRHISRAMTEVTLRLAEPEGVSTDAIVSVGQAIRREVAALGDGIERAVARASELESMVRGEVATLERAYDENENRVRSLLTELHTERDSVIGHATQLREAVANAHEAFAFDVQNIADRVSSALDNVTGRITDNILLRAEEARTQISDSGNIIIETFSDKSAEATQRLAEAGNTIAESLSDKSAEATQRLTEVGVQIAKAIADRNEKVSEELVQSTADMHAKLSERAAGISQMIAESGQTFENTIGQQLQNLADTVLNRGNEIASRVSADAGALGDKITENIQTFETTVKVHGANIAGEIKATIDGITEASHDSLAALDMRVAAKVGEVSGQIDERISRIETSLDDRAKNLNETLANRTLEIAKTIADGSKTATEAVDQSVTGMGEYFSAKTAEMAATLSERAAKIDETLGNRAMQLTATLDTRVNKFEELIVNRLETVTSTIEQKGLASADLLVERVNAVNENVLSTAEQVEKHIGHAATQVQQNLGDAAAQVEKRITDTAMQAGKRIDETATQVEKRITDTAMQAGKRIDETATQVEKRIGDTSLQTQKNLTELADGITENFIHRVNSITGAHETLRAEVRDIIAELGQTHGLLQAAIDTASSTLGPIESRVAEKVQSFHQTLESTINATRSTADRMDHQIRSLNESSNGVLRDVSNLTLRFEEQVRLVAATTESLNETHRRIDQGLESRKTAITQLTDLLSERTNELEERLTRFNKMLDDTFEHAQGKAQDVARMVAESTAGATQSIARQYELIRSSSTEERERTNVALKDTYEEAMRAVNAMFSETNSRFLEASRDLREISDDIQRTLDSTREEIRRTVFELPTETRESANAMRRVVADQIKALSELNDIVARHGRHAEVATAQLGYREEELAAVGGRSAPRNALPRPAYNDADDLPPAPPARREPAPEPRRPAARTPDRSARFDEALNKNARQPEPELEDITTGIESLDSLSIDIARMIEHDAAAEAWERFKRGERGVFNRRLYTTAGQKAFEDIRKKYRRNAEFRETVDRYIDEFEKLLEQVSRDDRGQALTKTYLTSDTGKVYTLLAHAAGRLG
ncbi:MAG: hypothetical protein AB7O46_02405 [Xanthobacteraceae bacterium]|nr:hypothetical protein [Xanthobacteraceae bacterium]